MMTDCRIQKAVMVDKWLILMDLCGTPGLTIRYFQSFISKKFPYIIFSSQTDCDKGGFQNHRIMQMGSYKMAGLYEELTIPRLHPIGCFPFQLDGLIVNDLSVNEIQFMSGHMNVMIASQFIDKKSSLGGTNIITPHVDELFSFFEQYSYDELLLEPNDGLRYYMLHEKII